MHLCDIPVDRISSVEIPTGLPLVYDFQLRKIRLLQEELPAAAVDSSAAATVTTNTTTQSIANGSTGRGLLAKYNFGDSPELLFQLNDTNKVAVDAEKDDIIIRLR